VIVVDTHILVWWVQDNRSRFSDLAWRRVDRELQEGSVAVSSISAWEIAMLVRKGRLELAFDVGRWLDTVEATRGLSFVPVDNAVAVKSLDLPGDFHDDPADRIIVALARHLSAPLVTADDRIRRYPHVETLW
jgi:PIN domain nuclease of toxin-antitoxin system